MAWKARFCFVKRLVVESEDVMVARERSVTSARSVIDCQATPAWPLSSSVDGSALTANIACCAEILAVAADDSEQASFDAAAASAVTSFGLSHAGSLPGASARCCLAGLAACGGSAVDSAPPTPGFGETTATDRSFVASAGRRSSASSAATAGTSTGGSGSHSDSCFADAEC